MIEIKDLSVRYNEHLTALDGLSLKVDPGEFVLLTGPSGCGKSTLARCLNGLIPHSSTAVMTGQVVVDGASTSEHSVAEMATHVGLVFQNPPTQLFGSTVAEELAFGPRNLALPPDEVAERVSFAMEATRIEHLMDRSTQLLSGGEQQRVAIAAVLAMRPKLLVLDEPTSNLDLKGAEAVLTTVDRLRREHDLTVVIIEHRLNEAAKYADRILAMKRGIIVLDAPPEVAFDDKDFLSRLGMRYPEWTPACDGLAAHTPGAKGVERASRPLVEFKDVEAGYDGHKVLRGLGLCIYPGEFVALVGDNGTGKTTVARLLAGLLKPSSGQVVWDGSRENLPLGRRVGLLFQNPLDQLFCDSVEEEVAFGPRNFGLSCAERMETILDVAGLSRLRRRNPYALSVGQQQRVALASVLALDPALLILDEPTMGQDWASLSRVMDFLTQLNGHGQAILLITHDYKLVCRYAQRILLLEDGKVSTVAPSAGPFTKLHQQKERLDEVLSA
jgi:energy-coupling factor transporter ATP-binding protein EcfA2